MNTAELEQIVIAATARQLRIDPLQVHLVSSLQKDLGADSMGIVEVILSLEEQLSVVIPDEVLPELTTVGDIVRYLEAAQE